MKKFVLFCVSVIIFLYVSPSFVFAIDIQGYMNPNNTCENDMSSGEHFSTKSETVPYNNQSGFIITKSSDPRWYERFGYDNDYIYHYEDTTWASDGGNEKCNGTNDDASTMYFNGNFGSPQNTAAEAQNHQSDIGMKWIKKNMAPGECFSSQGTIVGINKRTGAYCDTPHTGPGGGHTMCATSTGPVCLPTGINSSNALTLTVAGGAGSGEQYIYDENAGWIGFDGNYATSSNCLNSQPVAGCAKPTKKINPPSTFCSGNAQTDQGIFRPHAYSICKVKPVTNAVSSTATSFEIIRKKTIDVGDIRKSPECGGTYYPQINWSADISESWDKPRLSVAGFGESNKDSQAVSKYAADYFEGTSFYDKEGIQPVWQHAFEQGGVFRKLAPGWYQDTLKCQMIKKAQTDNQLNYNVKLKWADSEKHSLLDLAKIISSDSNLIAKTGNFFTTFKGILFNALGSGIDLIGFNEKNLKDIGCPPVDSNDRFWYQFTHPVETHLWAAVPMFTREDTPGQVTISAQYPPGKLTDTSGDGVTAGSSAITYPLSVPHLARLNEVSKTTYNMLMPTSLQSSTTAEKSGNDKPIVASDHSTNITSNNIASTNSMNLPASNLLAADPSNNVCAHPFDITIDNVHYDGAQLLYAVQFTNNPPTDGYQCHLYVNGKFWGGCIKPGGTRLDAGNSAGLVNSVPAGPNGTYTISATGQLDKHKPCGFTGVESTSCQVTLTARVVTATTCGPVAAPPACPSNLNGHFSKDPEDTRAVKDPKDPNQLNNLRKNGTKQRLDSENSNPLEGADKATVDKMWDDCYDPILGTHHDCGSIEFTYKIGINQSVVLPYLNNIWEQTAQDKRSGLFNIFTPGNNGKFPTVNSKSDIQFSAQGDGVTAEPDSGSVYYPFLQGIYDAQVCVSERLLQPANWSANVSCPNFK